MVRLLVLLCTLCNCLANDLSLNIVPEAPSIIGYYQQEIERLDKCIEPFKVRHDFDKKLEASGNELLKNSNFLKEWAKIQEELYAVNSGLFCVACDNAGWFPHEDIGFKNKFSEKSSRRFDETH